MEYLDYLTVFLGCPYLSDLKRCRINRRQADTLRALPIHMFEKKSYFDAVRYLATETPTSHDIADAKEAVIQALAQKGPVYSDRPEQRTP